MIKAVYPGGKIIEFEYDKVGNRSVWRKLYRLEDIILGLQVMTGFAPPGLHPGIDVTENGKIGMEDIILLLEKTAGLKP